MSSNHLAVWFRKLNMAMNLKGLAQCMVCRNILINGNYIIMTIISFSHNQKMGEIIISIL